MYYYDSFFRQKKLQEENSSTDRQEPQGLAVLFAVLFSSLWHIIHIYEYVHNFYLQLNWKPARFTLISEKREEEKFYTQTYKRIPTLHYSQSHQFTQKLCPIIGFSCSTHLKFMPSMPLCHIGKQLWQKMERNKNKSGYMNTIEETCVLQLLSLIAQFCYVHKYIIMMVNDVATLFVQRRWKIRRKTRNGEYKWKGCIRSLFSCLIPLFRKK